MGYGYTFYLYQPFWTTNTCFHKQRWYVWKMQRKIFFYPHIIGNIP